MRSEIRQPSLQDRRAALLDGYPTWRPLSVHEHLDRVAAADGDRPYLLFDDGDLTYREVTEISRRYAAGLRELGIVHGDHVGLLMANHRELPLLKFAVSRLGAVAVSFNFRLGPEDLAVVIRHSRCRILVTMDEFEGSDYLALLDTVQPGWMQGERGNFPDLEHIVVRTGRDAGSGFHRLEDVTNAAPTPIDDWVDPQAPSDILYTSGTTGLPKAVVLTHDALLRSAFSSALSRGFDDGWRILFALPMYHVFGYTEGLLASTFPGGAVIPRQAFTPADHFAAVERYEAHDILCVPTMTIAMLEDPSVGSYDLSSLRAMFSAGAPSPEWVWRRAKETFGVSELITGYGMTEMAGSLVITMPDDSMDHLVNTIGTMKLAGPAGDESFGLCDVMVVDPVSGERLPPDATGEWRWRGPVMSAGFWDGDAVLPVSSDGWLSSGDLGYRDDEGYFRITGRSKDVYKSGGELVQPTEVENLINRIEGVAQCYVAGVPDERWGEVGWAFVVRNPDARLSSEEIHEECRRKLARFKVPKKVVFVDAESLPKTATGKVQKFKLIESVS